MQVTGFVLGWRMTRDNLKFRQGVLPMIDLHDVLGSFLFNTRDGRRKLAALLIICLFT